MKKKTSDAVEILDHRFGGDGEWSQMVAEEELKARVAQLIYKLRIDAGFTQGQLAEKMGIRQPMVSKLENADYGGSALEMLWRVCMVLQRKVEIECPDEKEPVCRVSLMPA